MTCIEIKSINLRGLWNLEILNEECPICRNNILECCVECPNIENSECISIIGECSHVYHLHCIEKWIKTKNVCPLDNKKWQYKKNTCCNLHSDISGNLHSDISSPTGSSIGYSGPTGPTGSSIGYTGPTAN